jgi:acyl-CoA thioesterase I
MTEHFSPYREEPRFKEALDSNPDIVIFMLGTNDSWYWNWDWSEETSFNAFQKDYIEMVQEFIDLPSKPQVYVMVPPPIYKDNLDIPYPLIFIDSEDKINNLYPKVIPHMAAEKLNLPEDQVIDLFTPLGGKDLKYPFLYEDGLHPTDQGYRIIARTVQCHIQTCEEGWQ